MSKLRLMSIMAVAALAAAPAFAAFTTVNVGDGDGSEPSGWGVLDKLLDGSIDGDISSTDFNTGSFSIAGVSRVDDLGDQFWQDGTVEVNLQALFFGNDDISSPGAGTPHSLSIGFENGGSAGTLDNLIPHTASLGTSATFSLSPGDVFSFLSVRSATPTDGDSFASWTGSNVDGWSVESRNTTVPFNSTKDRMVTIALDTSIITELFDLGTGSSIDISAFDFAHIHFFDTGTDGDYQDSIWLSLGARPVPAPAAAVLAALGLGLASIKRRLS
jgi:hypothetical protein